MQEEQQDTEVTTILDVVAAAAAKHGIETTFYATDPSTFWMTAEQQATYPCCGVYEAVGAMTVDAVGTVYPRYEVYLIVEGGTMDERDAPSKELAAARAKVMGIIRDLRPWILGTPPTIVNFARTDSLYSLWVELSLFDPNTTCPDEV